MEEIISLRAHHLLCTVLYVGHGYSPEFEMNMSETVKKLREGCSIVISKSPDVICADCPNKLDDGGCRLDKKCTNKRQTDIRQEAASLDELILEKFNIDTDRSYVSGELFSRVRDKITPDDFAEWCNECRWHKSGFCTYEKYIERIDGFCH